MFKNTTLISVFYLLIIGLIVLLYEKNFITIDIIWAIYYIFAKDLLAL